MEDLPLYANRILQVIKKRKGKASWKDIMKDTRLSGYLISEGIRLLKEKGLVEVVKDKTGRVIYVLKT